MIYFTVVKKKNKYILDSMSYSYESLLMKFPQEIIYKSETPLTSIYIQKSQLIQ